MQHRQSRHITSSFSIAFLSIMSVVCLFERVPTSIVLQPRDWSMSFCPIHTESVCLLSNPFIDSRFLFSSSFLLRPSLFISWHSHAYAAAKNSRATVILILVKTVEICFCKDPTGCKISILCQICSTLRQHSLYLTYGWLRGKVTK